LQALYMVLVRSLTEIVYSHSQNIQYDSKAVNKKLPK